MCIFIVRPVNAREETESGVADNFSLWQIAENGALFLLVRMGNIINQNRIIFFKSEEIFFKQISMKTKTDNDFGSSMFIHRRFL